MLTLFLIVFYKPLTGGLILLTDDLADRFAALTGRILTGPSAAKGGNAIAAAAVLLISDSDAGRIRYDVAVNFFPHKSPDDFAISYDAYFSSVVFEAAGRRSKKREEKILELLQDEADAIASKNGGIIFWDRPLIEVRRG